MRIIEQIRNNRTIAVNMGGAFAVKGLSLFLSLFTMPAYIRYFNNQAILGIWYTMISVLNWFSFFDLGIGNGLRNMLPEAIREKDDKKIKQLISTTYTIMALVAMTLILFSIIIAPIINWNKLLNIESCIIERDVLNKCMIIVFVGICLHLLVKLINSILYAIQKAAIVNFLVFCSTLIIVVSLYIVPSTTTTENLIRMAYINSFALLMPYIIATILVFRYSIKQPFPSPIFFQTKYVKPIMKIGISILLLQVAFMIISSTNEYIISFFTKPEYVVDYQAYFKIFKTGAMAFSLALTPIWSAVTKAQAEKNYTWIISTYKAFIKCSGVCFLLELMIIPFLGQILNVWLGDNNIQVSVFYGIVFAFSGSIFVLHNVNTSIGNGMSYLSLQMIWMGLAAILDIPLSYLLINYTGGWIGVVIANVIVLIPYNSLAPFYTIRKLKMLEKSV